MSYLSTIIDFIQNLSLKDAEINNLLKEVDERNKENTQHENQLEEFEREHGRLQIEYHNLETISSFNDISAFENLNHTSQKMYKDCVELKSLIDKIDFTKILHCNHMEMEAKCRKEWQPIEDCFVKTLNWHQQMEQRYIMKRYRQAEIEHREVEEASKNQLISMEESLKQSVELIKQAKDKRNNIIIVLIKGRGDLDDFSKKMTKLTQYQAYIEGLRQEKLQILSQLEQTHFKTFNPKRNTNSNNSSTLAITPKTETSNFIMPKFPSFSDILESFNQVQKPTNITTIGNSTSFCLKSILHTSKTSITTKQTKNVRFKVQLEEYQEEITKVETETDMGEESHKTTIELNEPQDSGENSQEIKNSSEIETIDLLTPAESTGQDIKETKEIASKPMLDIQDCVVFKTPFPIEELKFIKDNEENKENVPDNGNLNYSQHSNDMCASSSPHHSIKELLNTTKHAFEDEFLKDISSTETSPKKITDFENFLNDNNDNVFFSMDSNDKKQMNAQNYSSDMQEILDFGSNRGFTFDSDDNMGNSYNSGNMDFM